MVICEWMQQCAGVNGRFVDTQGSYTIDATTFDIPFENIYNGGGLIGIRAVEASADAAGDKLYKGIAEVLRGDGHRRSRPTSGATFPTPMRWAATRRRRSSRRCRSTPICSRCSTRPSPTWARAAPDPTAHDLVYGGSAAKWIEAAHTLKARIYLHQVEKLGDAQYTSALAEAKKGISAPANDWKTAHSSATSERNMWAQFQNTSFGLDLVAGSVLVDIMKAQNDPRLADYFGKNSSGGFVGSTSRPAARRSRPMSQIVGSGRTNDPTFRQPIITYDETQLIIAEAAFQTNDKATATTSLNAVRARYGKAAIASADAHRHHDREVHPHCSRILKPGTTTSARVLPVLKPARGKTRIPGRLFYGATEEQTNPNTQPSGDQNLFSFRNANDPNWVSVSLSRDVRPARVCRSDVSRFRHLEYQACLVEPFRFSPHSASPGVTGTIQRRARNPPGVTFRSR